MGKARLGQGEVGPEQRQMARCSSCPEQSNPDPLYLRIPGRLGG